jgi:hypothetical protein
MSAIDQRSWTQAPSNLFCYGGLTALVIGAFAYAQFGGFVNSELMTGVILMGSGGTFFVLGLALKVYEKISSHRSATVVDQPKIDLKPNSATVVDSPKIDLQPKKLTIDDLEIQITEDIRDRPGSNVFLTIKGLEGKIPVFNADTSRGYVLWLKQRGFYFLKTGDMRTTDIEQIKQNLIIVVWEETETVPAQYHYKKKPAVFLDMIQKYKPRTEITTEIQIEHILWPRA